MNGFDFLSKAPMNFIFDKKANKTNLGGVFTLIYLLIVILIILTYMYDYLITPRYTYQYSYEYQYIDNYKSLIKNYNDKILNPDITFNIRIPYKDTTNTSNFLIIYANLSFDGKLYDYHPIEFGKDYTKKLYDLAFFILYDCDDNDKENCSLNEEEKKDNLNAYKIVFNYSGFIMDHQNKSSPIKKGYIQDNYIFAIGEKVTFNILRWKTINYTEEKGLFDKLLGKESNTFYGGEFLDPLIYTIDTPHYFKPFEKDNNVKILGLFTTSIVSSKNYFDYYIRKEKDIFKSIANICSLSLTAYKILTFLFCTYYSKNFDNYKIIQKILFKNEDTLKGKKKNKNIDIKKFNNNIEKKEVLLELADSNTFNEIENNIDKVKKEEEDFYNNDFNKKEENIDEDENKLPKLHFYDFLFNNIFCKKCCEIKKQQIISKCNEIVLKYYSIDYILYNQIKLENLFKDYKWNNPELNNIENNKLLNDLKLIS